MKLILVAAAALASAPGLALGQSPSMGCEVDPENPELAAWCGELGDVIDASAAVCGDTPLTLGDALAAAGDTPERAALVRQVLGVIASETGREMSPLDVASAIRDPKTLESMMTVSVPQVVAGLKRAQAASDARGPAPAESRVFKLPDGVDLANAPSFFDAAMEPPRTVSGSLKRGDKPSDLDAESVKRHRAFGEILDRLADNAGKPPLERFRVTYRGHGYSTVDGLLAALERNGHQVTATVSQGVANFLDLYVERDGQLCEVESGVRIRTGHLGPDGREVIVPAVHSGLKVRIQGPDLNAGVSFFQGVSGTGFFAEGLGKDQSWVGGRDIETYAGGDAKKAIANAAMWRKTVNDLAGDRHLFGGGYGQTGLCNDSVALIQALVTGRTTIYPLAMDKALVTRYLESKVAEKGPLHEQYRTLLRGVRSLPSDAGSDPTQPSRILDSIPYGPGPTPFPGVDHAREVLPPRG